MSGNLLSGVWSAVDTASGTVYESGGSVVSGQVILASSAILDVGAGAVASGVESTSAGGATINVSGGGELLDSPVNGGVVLSANSGADILDITVSSGGSVYISSGVTASDITAASGGSVYISSGATVSDITAASGGSVYISSGATVSDIIADSGGLVSASTGYGLTSLTAESGGTIYVSQTNSLSGLTISSGGTVYATVSSAANVSSPTVLEMGAWSAVSTTSGTVYESSGAIVSGPVVFNGDGSLVVEAGAVVSGISVDTDGSVGYIYVNSGGVIEDSHINNAYITLSSGATSLSNYDNSTVLYVSSGATSLDDTFSSGGAGADTTGPTYVYSGGVLSGAVISSITSAYIYTGASAADITVSSGGSLYVYSGATASDVTVYSSGLASAASGADMSGYIASNGGIVSSGASTFEGSVSSNNVPVLDMGIWSAVSTTSGTVYESGGSTYSGQPIFVGGGTLYVESGADVSGIIMNNDGSVGSVDIESGGTVTDSQINNDYVYISSGGTSTDNQLNSVELTISSGGTSLNDTFLGSGPNVDSNGPVYVSSGGILSGAIISNNVSVFVSSGADPSDITVSSGGIVYISSGGTVSDVTVYSSGFVSAGTAADVSGYTVSKGGTLFSGASTIEGTVGANNAQVLEMGTWSAVSTTSGTVYESSGGATVSGPVVLDGVGSLVIEAGAVVSGISVDTDGSIGYIYISSGGVIEDSNINNAYITLSSGATSLSNYDNSTVLYVSSGATSLDDTFSSGGAGADTTGPTYVYSGGVLSGAVISNITSAYIYSGASAADITVSSGGSLYVTSGAYVTDTTVASSGYAEVDSGGDGSGFVISSGGTVNVLGGSVVGVTLSNGGTLDYGPDILACFLRGTLIRTPIDEVAVENLQIGDQILAHDQLNNREVARDVTWVGCQTMRVDASLPDDEAGYPVRIVKDALSAGVPYQDLLVTSEHCMYLEGRFIPVRMLVNGSTIYYDRSFTQYEFYHVETSTHSVITANGALSESYLDTGDRRAFEQPHAVVAMGRRQLSWEHDAAAPLCVEREIVEGIHIALSQRAAELGAVTRAKTLHTTPEHDLQIITPSGEVLQQVATTGKVYAYLLPLGVESVRLVSRAARPADTIGPFVDDRRYLGVKIGAVMVSTAAGPVPVQRHLQEAELAGWHGLEEDAPGRWTNGDALLPIPLGDSRVVRLLTIEVCGSVLYELEQAQAPAQTVAARRA